MIREIDLAFIKIHILYHADQEAVYGVGLIAELGRHGYRLGPGTLYPTLAKMEKRGLLTCERRTVKHKQRKYYRITPAGQALLKEARRKTEELYKEVLADELLFHLCGGICRIGFDAIFRIRAGNVAHAGLCPFLPH